MNEFREWDLGELVDLVTTEEWGMPVRAMEAVLAHGAAAVHPLLAVLGEGTADEGEETEPRFWPVVLLGELRDPAAAPALAEVIRRAGPADIALAFAAAEALAKIGPAALPALRSLAFYGASHPRLWAYYAAGRIDDDAAFEWLVAALQADPEMADVVALALREQGRGEAVEPIVRALATAEPWQRPELEDALVQLHGLRPEAKGAPEDWRLRYRWQPGVGFFPMNWATVTAIVRADERVRRTRAVPSARPLEEILAGARPEEPERCDCCGVPSWTGTGVPVCPQTAASVAVVQARLLGDVAEEESLDDLFDVLEVVEGRLAGMEAEAERASPAARRHRENLRTGLQVLRAGCIWLVQQGVETVGRGLSRLRTEAARAAEAHGTPLPALHAPPPAAPGPRVGRNEPCPCGSGRKFKKCCGAAAGQ